MIVPIDAMINDGIMALPKWVWQRVAQARRDTKYVKDVSRALALDYTQIGQTGMRHRSSRPGHAIHPDNLAGMVSILAGYSRKSIARKLVENESDLVLAPGSSILTVGGPVWETVGRTILGYKTSPDRLDARGFPTYYSDGLAEALPYRFNLDSTVISGRARKWSPSASGSLECTEGPNWGIYTPQGLRFPDLDAEQMLNTDYLLLTKLPNLLSDPSFGTGRAFVNFAGTHGVAQRAIDILMRDRSLVGKIAEILNIDVTVMNTWPTAYQVLLQASQIEHTQKSPSRAKALTLVHAIKIDETDEWWNEWRMRAAREWDAQRFPVS